MILKYKATRQGIERTALVMWKENENLAKHPNKSLLFQVGYQRICHEGYGENTPNTKPQPQSGIVEDSKGLSFCP